MLAAVPAAGQASNAVLMADMLPPTAADPMYDAVAADHPHPSPPPPHRTWCCGAQGGHHGCCCPAFPAVPQLPRPLPPAQRAASCPQAEAPGPPWPRCPRSAGPAERAGAPPGMLMPHPEGRQASTAPASDLHGSHGCRALLQDCALRLLPQEPACACACSQQPARQGGCGTAGSSSGSQGGHARTFMA
jgi:hypothetical protein